MWYPVGNRVSKIEEELETLANELSAGKRDAYSLILPFSVCASQLSTTPNAPPSILRDWLWIASRYRIDMEDGGSEIRKLSGTALLWLERNLGSEKVDQEDFIADLRWVTSKTVASLKSRLSPADSELFVSAALSDGDDSNYGAAKATRTWTP